MAMPGETAIADTLIVFSVSKGGTGRVEFHQTNQYLSNSTYHVVYTLNYELKNGGLVFLAPACPPGAQCAFIERAGRIDGDVLTINYESAVFRPRTYQRVS